MPTFDTHLESKLGMSSETEMREGLDRPPPDMVRLLAFPYDLSANLLVDPSAHPSSEGNDAQRKE